MKKLFVFLMFILFISNVSAEEWEYITEDVILNKDANVVEVHLNTTSSNIRFYENSDWNIIDGSNRNPIMIHDGVVPVNTEIASFVIGFITGTSVHADVYVDASVYKCQNYAGYWFGPNGELLSTQSEYKRLCYSNDNNLKSLQISSGTLSPNFEPSITRYASVVSNEISQVTFTLSTNHADAKVKSGATCNLSVGENQCNIIVEAANGEEKTYTVIVTREEKVPDNPPLSSDATISSFVFKNGTLTEPFDPNKNSYIVKIPSNVSNMEFSYVTNFDHMSHVVNFILFRNYYDLVITAPDGTTNTYHFQFEIEEQKNDEEDDPKNEDDSKDNEDEKVPSVDDNNNSNDANNNSNFKDQSSINEVENPETGDIIKVGTVGISIVILIVAIIILRKRNVIQKL